MGVAMELLSRHAIPPSEVGLLVTTGFLGGLTTFSTFSGEVVSLLMRGEYLWASVTAASHLLGSLALTVIGLLIVRAVYAWSGA
jgi:CrcB protein